ncbi:VCBS repeat-containing protein [Streptomyces sp. NPDC047981]|uniref:VCBS repeat-containing protein n=1 Tax=Streptomyces sp. NPDC047981 TaxID=3154610 RepID=UPI003424EE4E
MRSALSRRVSVSVGVVLAVAAPLLSVPATATAATTTVTAVPAATTATAPINVPFLASGGQVIGAGKTGFLTRDADHVERWTRYADGVSKVVGSAEFGVIGSASDVVLLTKARFGRYGTESATAYDMETGAAPVTFGGFAGQATNAVGTALFEEDMDGGIHLVTPAGGRPVAGLEKPNHVSSSLYVADSLPGAALAIRLLESSDSADLVVVDIAGARVSERYLTTPKASVWGASITPDRVVWVERKDGKSVLATAERGSTEVTREPLSDAGIAPVNGGLLGDWLVSNADGGASGGLTVHPLAGGAPVRLLDHAESVRKSGDGSLLALGTTADRGPGVYRVALGADGKPAAELIASTGEPPAPTTPVSFVSASVPATLNLDGIAKTPLSWKFSTSKVDLKIEFDYRPELGEGAESFVTNLRPRTTGTGVLPDGSLGIDWAGEVGYFGEGLKSAPNGTYDWTVTARPWNGMPPVKATGTFEVKRSPHAHDYTANGSSDVFARRADGELDVFDTRWDDATGRLVTGQKHGYVVWSTDWNAYDRVETTGDVAGDQVLDIVARDKAGVLWLYEGENVRSGSAPRRIGGGWGVYQHLAGGSDLTGDGRADLVAVEKAGDLYLYEGTGTASAPFKPRKKIGFGWGVYNELVAVGNVAGAPAGDLIARDTSGVLWLYLGKGDGTYAPRVKIGGGWNEYRDIVGIGDANKDGRPDLYTRSTSGKAYFYAGTGSWRAPFAPRAATTVGVPEAGLTYNKVF